MTSTFIGLEVLEKINKIMRLQLLGIFSSNLNSNLQILAEVGSKHLLQALKSLFDRKATKVINNPFRIEKISVRQNTLDIMDIGIVFQSLNMQYEMILALMLQDLVNHL
jgi:hypothetical protein